jgi:outer membrane protein OmpA-like peptidoglycan-associated protein
MKSRLLLAPALATVVSLAGAAGAQEEGGFALSQLVPSPAGDMFLSVPSPYAGGHLEPYAYLMFDYAHRPIRVAGVDESIPVVAGQGFMRLDAAMAFWDRLLVNVDVPLAVVQSGEDPLIANTTVTALEAPAMGDVRLGVRGRIWGENADPFQLGVGGYIFFPSGDRDQYTGQGGVRGAPAQVLLGGQIGNGVGFGYSASAGFEIRPDGPHAVTYGAGAALLVEHGVFQIGPELHGTTAVGGGGVYGLSSTPVVPIEAGTYVELLGSAKLRVIEGLTFGAGAGPGLTPTVGTPTFRALAMIGWTPLPGAAPDEDGDKATAAAADKDDDGIPDGIDACPEVAGEPSPDPAKDGCPPGDKDRDGIADVDDACPNTAGLPNAEVTKNGCPPDTDNDGQHDLVDACADDPGETSDDPKLNGCPRDSDGDSITDRQDSCPSDPGAPHDEPSKNGCPEDPDGDGIRYADDACPRDKGSPSADPKLNGCNSTRVTGSEIEIGVPIEFTVYGDSLAESVTPRSEKVLREVADAIKNRPEITRVEVQGHTDDSGEEQFNLDLSQRRAETVRKWLVDKGGVSADRLVAKGYGFSRPRSDNRMRKGRQENRRVQFVILEQKR